VRNLKIVNMMLSRDLGGIQKAFVNYSQMLKHSGHTVLNIVSQDAQITKYLESHVAIKNLGQWDFYSVWQLRKILKEFKPDCIIAHGSRAIIFCHYANTDKNCKLIGVAHNHNYKWFYKCDHILSITNQLADFLVSKQIARNQISILGNTLEITKPHTLKQFAKRTVIGTLSRLVPQKGIDVFLKAIAILQNKGHKFEVIVGGDGTQKQDLIKLAHDLKVEVKFIGWVEDKDSFYEKLDIFCLPSLYEPFGIVMLEAMMHSVPIVSSKAEGPLENITDGHNGILSELGSAEDLADKLLYLTQNQELAGVIAKNAYDYVSSNYSNQIIQQKLNNHLIKICSN